MKRTMAILLLVLSATTRVALGELEFPSISDFDLEAEFPKFDLPKDLSVHDELTCFRRYIQDLEHFRKEDLEGYNETVKEYVANLTEFDRKLELAHARGAILSHEYELNHARIADEFKRAGRDGELMKTYRRYLARYRSEVAFAMEEIRIGSSRPENGRSAITKAAPGELEFPSFNDFDLEAKFPKYNLPKDLSVPDKFAYLRRYIQDLEHFRKEDLEGYNETVKEYGTNLTEFDRKLEIARARGEISFHEYKLDHARVADELKRAGRDGELMNTYRRYLERYRREVAFANKEIEMLIR